MTRSGDPLSRLARRRLPHAVANDLAAAELRFVTVDRRVVLDLDDQIGIGEADAIAGGRAVVVRVGAAIDFHRRRRTPSTALSAAAVTFSSSSGPSTSC